MSKRCMICCAGALAVIAATSGTAAWRFTRTPPQSVRESVAAKAEHASPPQLLSALAERLHHEALAHFHADPKNGYARMPFVYEKVVKQWQSPWFSTGELDREEPVPFAKDMTRIHDLARMDFLAPPPSNANGAGSNQNGPAQGFAIMWEPGKYDRTKKVWEPKSVDLIGLLKHATPVVYVSEKIAHQTADEAVSVRPLDEFEMAGLATLEKGENLFGRTRDGVVRLLGAVRAESSCLKCHRQQQEGDLLGAFSYTLREAKYDRQAWPGKAAKSPPANGTASGVAP